MKICATANGKTHTCDVQKDRAHGMVVYRNGKHVAPGTRAFEIAVSEFRRVTEDGEYARREAAARAALETRG